jgi:hypothetical protein
MGLSEHIEGNPSGKDWIVKGVLLSRIRGYVISGSQYFIILKKFGSVFNILSNFLSLTTLLVLFFKTIPSS